MSMWSTDSAPCRHSGLTLIEMILFIVVLGVAGVALLTVLASPLTGAGTQTEAVTAAQVAQARMEVVLGYKRKNGFPENGLCDPHPDPCPGLNACDTPAGWNATTSCEVWSVDNDTSAYQVFVVTASGPDGGNHTVRTLVTRLGE